MGSSSLIFDPSSTATHHRNMLLLGASRSLSFRGVGGASLLRTEEIGSVVGVKRWSIFNSPEEMMMEDECCDGQLLPEKKRRLTQEQVNMLEKSFEDENKLEPERKIELARKLGLQPRQIAVWFQNRRARWKNKQLERDFDQLRSLYNALLADHDSLLADNQRLRHEVISLTEKLQAGTSYAGGAQTGLDSPRVDPLSTTGYKAEDQPSKSSTTVDVEEPIQLAVDSEQAYNIEEVDDGSYHGGCVYFGQSSEEDGSEDGGCGYYYHHQGVFPRNDYILAEQHEEEEEEEEASEMGWWVWS